MKAFIHKQDNNGNDMLGSNGMVTGEYKTLKGLIKHVLKGKQGKYHIEAFTSWDNRYGKADIDIVIDLNNGGNI